MIDFKKVSKESGHRAWHHIKLPKIPALQSEVGSNQCLEPVEVEFEIHRSGNDHSQWILKIHGGPTGYESVDLVKILENQEVGAKWIACMGSYQYRRLEIRIDNIRHAVSNYSVNYRFEVL